MLSFLIFMKKGGQRCICHFENRTKILWGCAYPFLGYKNTLEATMYKLKSKHMDMETVEFSCCCVYASAVAYSVIERKHKLDP